MQEEPSSEPNITQDYNTIKVVLHEDTVTNKGTVSYVIEDMNLEHVEKTGSKYTTSKKGLLKYMKI